MRPITLWDDREIVSYYPKPAAEKLRYVIIRASELKNSGTADESNGFYRAVDKIQAAIQSELISYGFVPTASGEEDAYADLLATNATQEEELIAQDEYIEALKAQIIANGDTPVEQGA
jgi:hypothetical protein